MKNSIRIQQLGTTSLTRTTVGVNYYFADIFPKVQTKLQFNYEFRHHQQGSSTTTSEFDAAANDAFLIQLQVRWM